MHAILSRKALTTTSAALLALAVVFPGQTSLADPTILTPTFIARTGDTAPGGGTYTSFNSPALNAEGQIVFTATLTGGASSSGVFTGTGEGVQAVALQGSAAPGGGSYNSFTGSPMINNAGKLVFMAPLSGTSTQGIFAGQTDSLSAVVLQGSAAPAGGTFATLMSPYLFNDAGQVAFRANLTGSTSTSGIFTGSPGSLQSVARAGALAPSGGTYGTFTSLALNSAGTVVFTANISGGSATSGVFTGTSESVQPVALKGNVAPGVSGATFASFTNPAINSANQVVFNAALTGGSATSGIFAGISGSVQAIAVQGDYAPGAAGAIFNSFPSAPVINALGQVAFNASLTGASATSGLFLGTPGSLSAIAVQGAPSPTGGNFVTISAPVLNANGQFAFTSTLTNPDGSGSTDSALFGGTSEGLFTIVRKGDVIDFDPSPDIEVLKTVSLVTLSLGSGGEDGRATALNDSGTVVYRVTFTDASSAVLSSPVPEPSSIAFLSLAGLALLSRRFARRDR